MPREAIVIAALPALAGRRSGASAATCAPRGQMMRDVPVGDLLAGRLPDAVMRDDVAERAVEMRGCDAAAP